MLAHRQRISPAAFALCACAVGFTVRAGYADGESPAGSVAPAAPSAPAVAPDRAYVEACARGNASYASGDFAGAAASYRQAIDESPHQPLGHYLLGEAQLAAGKPEEAEASWRRTLAESQGDPAMHARALFVLADSKERRKRWGEAEAGWQAYLAWASRFPTAGVFAASARSRLDAIERMTRQDRAYDVVRRRIQETGDGGVFSNVASGADAGG